MPPKSGRSRQQPPRDLRQRRDARATAAPSAKTRWPWLAAAGIGAAILIGLLVLVTRGNQAAPQTAALGEIMSFGTQRRDHVEAPQRYAQTPPIGGAHSARWQNCGLYDTPLPNEKAVHSMEHGAVWITYREDLPADAVERLRVLTRGHTHMLLSPYPGQSAPVVASAWSTQMRLDRVDEPKLLSFINTYERGRQTPEPGAACHGGVGTPIER